MSGCHPPLLEEVEPGVPTSTTEAVQVAASKWQHPTSNLKINDVVIIRDDYAFTCHWPVAVVTKVYPGADDLVRVVQLRVPSQSKPMTSRKDLIKSPTSYTILKRPVTKIALLFRPDDSTDDF